jgi:hypothetical protein
MLIFLAGAESQDAQPNIMAGQMRNAFYSYYYMKGKGEPKTLIEGRKHLKNIIIDSGAHTFFSERNDDTLSVSAHKKKTKTKETPFEYFEEYKKWVVKWYDYFDYFVELDIGEIVGQEVVLKWREELKALKVYDKCITVYHPMVMSRQDYILMLEDSQSKYVALEGVRPYRPDMNYNQLIKMCYDRGIKVHGFAMVKKNVMDKWPFYSVDSSSWKAGNQYGASLAKVGTKTKTVGFNKHSKDLYKFATQVDNVKDALQKDDLKKQRFKRMELAIIAYNEMEDYYTQLWDKRGVKWK